jgi:hypothetical protein
MSASILTNRTVILAPLFAALLLGGCVVAETPNAIRIVGGGYMTAEQMERVGKRIWQNECGGTVAGLTSWNKGEDFASLGIGHFIWYPAGRRGPFEESFPEMVKYLKMRGVPVADWMLGACPWPNKAAFDADLKGAKLTELRALLAKTTGEQTDFIYLRLMAIQGLSGNARESYLALRKTPEGLFCLIDYVNFKGEGTNPNERYEGEGWGLIQVLQEMRAGTPAEFAEAAKRVLVRRVNNAPPERHEERWLAGWVNRCEGYKKKL